jgi:hypothetical protein
MCKQPLLPNSRFTKFFWRLIFVAVLFAGGEIMLRAEQIIYDDALENGWQNWGWATLNYTNTSPVHSGSDSISVTIAGAWQGIQIWHSDQNSTLDTNLSFWLNGGTSGGQKLQVYGLLHFGTTNNFAPSARYVLAALTANSWQQFFVPLSALGVAGQTNFTGFVIQDATGAAQPTFYMDDVSLTTNSVTATNAGGTGTNALITIAINAAANRLAISPLIYGVAFAATSNQLQDLNVPLHRYGGNATSRYNWQLNATSHAADWYFESIGDSPSTAGADGDSFILESKGGGAQAMLTIPIMGWVAKLGANGASLASYSVAKYGAQTGSDPWWADAGNGVLSANGLDITTNNPTDANQPVTTSFQAGWVRHLTNTWGNATNGGLQYYIMDNEWSLWDSTHRDVHPVGATMTEVFTNFCNYSTMVKGIDPNALVAGPEEWGWPGYLYSGYDQQWSGVNNDYNPADYPDRAAHGGQDFGPWFLSQVQQQSQVASRRLLDIFTLHCYPQEGSVSGDAVDAATELLRNQSTRQFWDTNYVDPSWINSVIALIPRMRSWVTTNYPGTKIGVTEYNWGAEPSINGATAQADILGIFGQQGLDLATRWTAPDPSTPTYLAIKMYRNYDGNKSTFGDTSIQTTVPNPDNLSAFSAVRSSDGAMTLMIINKDIANASPINASITNFNATGIAQRWQLTAANVITPLANLSFTNSVLKDTVPSQSITLYVLPAVSPFSLKPGPNLAAGQFTIWLTGQTGLVYAVQSSTDLIHWSGFATNPLASNAIPFSVSVTNSTLRFYRALWSP